MNEMEIFKNTKDQRNRKLILWKDEENRQNPIEIPQKIKHESNI